MRMREMPAGAAACDDLMWRFVAGSSREEIERLIERLIAHLDSLDGDPDAEPDFDGEDEPELDDAAWHPLRCVGR